MYVDVYRNLVKGGISVKAMEGEDYGRVIQYADEVVVEDVEFVVQPAGRQRVLDEQQKNVHAFVRGELVENQDPFPNNTTHVIYDPYKYDSFVTETKEEPVKEALIARVREGGVDAVLK